MFDFDASKLLIVGAIALIFIPPKDLPRVLRQVGQFVGKMRRMASEFQGQFMDAMREADMADLREEARNLAAAAKAGVGFDAVADLKSHLTGAIEGKPMTMDTVSSPTDPARSMEAAGPEPRQIAAEDNLAPCEAVAATAPATDRPVPRAAHAETVHAAAPRAEAAGTHHRVDTAVEASVVSSSA